MNESFNLIVSNRLEVTLNYRMRLVRSEFFRATNSLFEPESITVNTGDGNMANGGWLSVVRGGNAFFIRDTIERILVAYLEAYPQRKDICSRTFCRASFGMEDICHFPG